MKYYVFHDNATSRTRIHNERCVACNHGRGTTRPHLPPNPALWSGPFDTIDEATETMRIFAAHKRDPDVGRCPLCLILDEEVFAPRPGPR